VILAPIKETNWANRRFEQTLAQDQDERTLERRAVYPIKAANIAA
jgi:hypothetical protein